MKSFFRNIVTVITIGLLMAASYYIGSEKESFLPSEVVASNQSAATFTSTMDLQRELNRRDPKLKLKVDGVYGPLTQAAHERAIGDQYAKELMVKVVK